MNRRNRALMRLASATLVAVLLPTDAIASRVSPAPQQPEPPLGLDLYMHVSDDNPLTPAKVALARLLFFDPLLSAARSRACACCHEPARALTAARPPRAPSSCPGPWTPPHASQSADRFHPTRNAPLPAAPCSCESILLPCPEISSNSTRLN